ncbi:MAG: FecR family protein [Massilibacteroides sp.]|nr:FecR family protein [Massilibacteroides sp.]
MKDPQRKTDYFLNSCTPVVEDGVVESIHKKTFEKIEECKEHLSPVLTTNTGKKKKIWITVFSSAVAAIFILAIFLINYVSSDKPFMNIVAMTEQQIQDYESNEILLILSDSRQIRFSQDDIISFTSEGALANSMSSICKRNNGSTQNTLNQLLVPKGMRSQLLLSDGTKIWINAGSRIVFPPIFSKEKRQIYIDGEAYLEVAPNRDRPFFVTANGFEIKVLGTSFNVFAYKEDEIKEVALVSGKIEITDEQNQVLEMKPDELVTFSQNCISEKKYVNAKDYKSWIDKILILNGETLESIAHRLTLIYGVKIVCDFSIGEEEVFGKLDLKNNIEKILNYLELMLPLSVTKEDNTFYLRRKQTDV